MGPRVRLAGYAIMDYNCDLFVKGSFHKGKWNVPHSSLPFELYRANADGTAGEKAINDIKLFMRKTGYAMRLVPLWASVDLVPLTPIAQRPEGEQEAGKGEKGEGEL